MGNDSTSRLLAPEQLNEMFINGEYSSDEYLIIDLCKTDQYYLAHLPFAQHCPITSTQSSDPVKPGDLPNIEHFQDTLKQLGYHPDKKIITYDDEFLRWASRMIWILDIIGHKESYLLDGGLRTWLAEGFVVESDASMLIQTPDYDFTKLTYQNMQWYVDYQQTLELVNHPESSCIWDARSQHEYHKAFIPGAFNYDWVEAMDPGRNFRLKDLEQIRQMLESNGMSNDKTLITYCQSNHRSAFAYFIARELGLDIKAYAGSWSEWSQVEGAPKDRIEPDAEQ